MKTAAALLGLIILAGLAPAAAASMAAFETYPETTTLKAPFNEAVSGITFSNPQNAAGYFGVDYGASTANVPDLPGKFLTGNGASLGDPFALAQDFGFDAMLPAKATAVTMDLIYLNDNPSVGTITLSAFDAAGKQVATATITPTRTAGSGYRQTSLSLQSATGNVQSFSVRTTNLASGFDNVSFAATPAPEPGSVFILVLLLPVLMGRGVVTTEARRRASAEMIPSGNRRRWL